VDEAVGGDGHIALVDDGVSRLRHQRKAGGYLRTMTPGGPTFHVKVYTWHIAPQQDFPSFPLEGTATFEVRAGEVQTTIDGQTAERREGDHWAVAEGAQLRLKTGNDSVSLQGVVAGRSVAKRSVALTRGASDR